MLRCKECDEEIAESNRYCPNCGRAVHVIPLTEKLKVVTTLFFDLVDSELLTARLGAKVANDLSRECYAHVRNAVREEKGMCGQWAGDGVMAVFGVPTLNDDDALRAARVAIQVRDDIAALSTEFYRKHGMPVEMRIGINTGQALVRSLGPVEERVAGLQVIMAKRLEEAADKDAILIGEATFRLVKDRVHAVPVYPLIKLKSMPDPVPAWRLLGIDEGHAPTRPDGPLIGRSRDLTLLLHLLDRVEDDHACHIATIVGQPGIGKSRLIREFERQVRNATVFKSACLPYGEGITFWPIAEMVRQAAGVGASDTPESAMERLGKLVAREPDGKRIIDKVGQLLGWVSDVTAVSDADLIELHRALSQLFQVLARSRPLVLIFDDLQWADQGLIDSIREIATSAADVPILLLCLARPELVAERPNWTRGLVNTTILRLPRFKELDGDRLVKHLLEGRRMADEAELLDYIRKHADGNPLFMESYLAMLQERDVLQKDEHGHWKLTVPLETVGEQVPPRLRMIISARLERLEPALRTTLDRAAVVGGKFHAANIVALSPGDPVDEVLTSLDRLAQKGLILVDPGAAAKLPLKHGAGQHGERGYRVLHMLYRDVAYESLPDDQLGTLHELYARWLEQESTDTDSAEIQTDELIAYHFVQAHQKSEATDPASERTRQLALRAAERLLTAGQRANRRGDIVAALASLEPAVALLPEDHPRRPEATLELADVLRESDANRAAERYEEVVELATAAGDKRLAMHARLGVLDLVGLYADPERPLEEGEGIAEQAVATFQRGATRPADHRGLAKAWRLRGFVQYATGRNTDAMKSIAEAQKHTRAAEDERLEASMRSLSSTILFWGPTPLRSVKPQLDTTLAWARKRGSRGLEATALGLLARAAAMGGDYAEARRLNELAAKIRAGTGEFLTAAAADSISSGLVELLARQLDEAEKILRQAYEDLQRMGGTGPKLNVSILLARTLLWQGSLGEAEDLTVEIEKAVPIGLIDPRIKWRSIRAVVKARRGDRAEAERLIDEAIEMADVIEQPDSKAEAYFDRAEILQSLGRQAEAEEAATISYDIYEEQGNVSAARRVRGMIAPLDL